MPEDVIMGPVFPPIEPYVAGTLEVGEGHAIYWETCGDPSGDPLVVIHGGPGSGCTPWHRRMFDPTRYRIVLFDQRGCGRSAPHASAHDVDLSTNTTQRLLDDIDRLREHLRVDRWVVWGGSWGCTLALAYAETHADNVAAMILWGITTGRRTELDWLFRGGLGRLLPEEWELLRAGVPEAHDDADVAACYLERLRGPDTEVADEAARAWCTWETATAGWPPERGLAERYQDPAFALAFARLVTHYVTNDLFLEDGALLRDLGALADVPAVMVNGRFDLQAPLGNAWALHRAWAGSELIVVDDAGHAADDERMVSALIDAGSRRPR
jgi:proline iminopeptidase